MINFADPHTAAHAALTPTFPTSDPHAFTTHGCVCSVPLDSDLIDQSNWHVISRDLLDSFGGDSSDLDEPDVPDVYTHASPDGAMHLMVRIRDGDGDYTAAFLDALEWADNLEFYPVADEGDYLRREDAADDDP